MTILDMLESDGFMVKKVASTHGGEYAGPCPGCGGIDRFLIWPEQKGGRYWCRQCKKSGDAIQYLRDFRNMTYPGACHLLGEVPKARRYSAMPPRYSKPTFTPKDLNVPVPTWQEKAKHFLERSQSCLWSDQGTTAREFLHTQKGLSDATIRTAGLGWNPSNISLGLSSWGLPAELKPDGKFKNLWLPAGLVIPCKNDDNVIRLRIRRSDPGDGRRYITVSGSDSCCMIWGMFKTTKVIVESELDGLLVYQEAGDLVGTVALGSAQAKPDYPTHDALKKADKIIVALDHDDAGAKAAWNFWPETYGSKVRRWPVVCGKDPSAAWENGLDIRQWIIAGISIC
jgi:DNA primase